MSTVQEASTGSTGRKTYPLGMCWCFWVSLHIKFYTFFPLWQDPRSFYIYLKIIVIIGMSQTKNQ